MKMKPATLLLNLSVFFMLTLTGGVTATSQNIFTCNSDSTCESLIDYVLPNSTTRLSQIAALFGVKSLFGISDEANLLAGAVLDVPLRAYGPSNNADGSSNNVSKIGLQESRCWWLVISLSLSSLLSGLLM